MLNFILNLFRPRSFETITTSLTKIINDLEEHAAEQTKLATEKNDQVYKLKAEITSHDAAYHRAVATSYKLKDLLS